MNSGINNCNLERALIGVHISNPDAYVEIDNTSISNVTQAAIAYEEIHRGGHIRNCNLEKGEKYVVDVSPRHIWPYDQPQKAAVGTGQHGTKELLTQDWSPGDLARARATAGRPSNHLDMTNNYWGTTDPDSIQAWIFDGHDTVQDTIYYGDWPYYIDWDPFLTEVGTEKEESLGAFKAMFR